MHKAVEDTAKAGTGGSESIANVAAGGNAADGAGADKDSVTGIAKGMKAIVDAAKKAGVELKAADVAVAAGADAADAGKLFASGNNGAGVAAQAQGAAEKAGEAVSAVSGDQILKAIVDAAGSTEGKGAGDAKNAVEAAIGADAGAEAAAFGAGMQKKNQIAAAIVLRGLAKDGKFANAANTKVKAAVKTSEWIKEMHKAVEDTAKAGTGGSDLIANVAAGAGAGAGAGAKADVGSVTGIAKGMKAIVDAAKKAGVELKAADADDAANNDAGKLFASGNNAGGDAQGAAEKAGEAVSAVSGDQILKAIVDAAESTEGKSANTATNAVEAAIGGGGDAAAFGAGMQKKNQIAAAIVLRGLAKDGKFANANNADDANTKVVAAVKTSEWIKEMHKAVEDTAKAGAGSNDELIANVAVGGGNGNGNGAGADKGSVTGIAKGMKAIVDAAKKAGVELKADDAADAVAGADDDAQGAAEKAGEAVSAASGDQILKAIVDAAGSTAGKRANTAKNAVEAAIGGDGDEGAAGAAFGNNMKKNQIAAAIVLRGLAKGGKFANANNDANGKVVAAVKHMHRATLRLL
ncbi:variable large family protein [Borreliella burgdorferi]|uniref:variable large family protein n=1 Tax=Borreliella burgdorferi TaxID=139 RepID=UPI003AB19CE6